MRALGIEVRSSPSWTHHPVLGWTQVPGLGRRHLVEGRPVRIEVNALGFRDVDHALAKPPGTRRVVVIGDSAAPLLRRSRQLVRLVDHARRNVASFRLVEGNLLWLLNHVSPPDATEPDAAKLRDLGFSSLPPVLYAYVPEDSQPDAVAAAWRVTERLLREIVERCRERAVPVVALLTPFEARLGERWPRFALEQPAPPMQRDYADERLSRLLRSLDVPVIPLKPLLERELDTGGRYAEGHLGPAGHDVAAEAIYARLRELGFVTSD